MVNCVGYRNGKYLIKESEPGTRLRFTVDGFKQVDPPKNPTQYVDFSLSVNWLRRNFPGFLPSIKTRARKKRP